MHCRNDFDFLSVAAVLQTLFCWIAYCVTCDVIWGLHCVHPIYASPNCDKPVWYWNVNRKNSTKYGAENLFTKLEKQLQLSNTVVCHSCLGFFVYVRACALFTWERVVCTCIWKGLLTYTIRLCCFCDDFSRNEFIYCWFVLVFSFCL